MGAIRDWKPDQKAVLDASGDMVLTASAGTGKTTILVEKFIRILLDDAEHEGADALRRMVGITFTELAAAELKERIRERLVRAIQDGGPNSALQRIVRDLDSAYIGTIHSFCNRILRENFVAAGLSPAFSIISEEDVEELRLEAADAAAQSAVNNGGPELVGFATVLRLWGLRQVILDLSDKLRADGVEHFDVEALTEGFLRQWSEEAGPLLEKAAALLRDLQSLAEEHLATAKKPGKTIEKNLPNILAARAALEPLLDDPQLLLKGGLPPELLRKSAIGFAGSTLDEFNETLGELRRLVGIADVNDETVLLHYAGAAPQVAVIRAVLDAVADFNRRFAELKDRRDALDFDDLQLRALRLLTENTEVRDRYRSQFRHIFVDEFQDVNAVQRMIIEALRGFDDKKSGEDRHIFIVGDGKQSIYRFRSANVKRFEEFVAGMTGRKSLKLDLVSNFRSHPALIDSFNSMFGILFTDAAENPHQTAYQAFTAGRSDDATGPRVELIAVSKPERRHEAMVIARRIRSLIEAGEHGPGDIAILLRSFTAIGAYELELRRAAIPYTVIGGRGFYQQREIWDIASWLKAVWFPADRYALAAVLRSPLCLLSDESLYRLALAGLLDGENLFENEGVDALLTPEERQRFSLTREIMRDHRSKLDALSPAAMIIDLLDRSGYDAFLLSRDGGDQGAANVRKLIELARAAEGRGFDAAPTFILDLNDRLFKQDEEPQASLGGVSDDVVRILTVHKSKGLEFPVVFLPHLHNPGRGDFSPLVYDIDAGFGVNPRRLDLDAGGAGLDGPYRRVKEAIAQQEEAESLRLLYVAMTRAREHLILPMLDEAAETAGQEPTGEKKKKVRKGDWWKRLDGLGIAGEDASGRFGVLVRSEDDLPGFKKPLSLRERLGELPQPSSIPSPAPGRPKKVAGEFRGSVWQLIRLVSRGGAAEEAENEMTALNLTLNAGEDGEATPRVEIGTAVHRTLERFAKGPAPSLADIEAHLRRQGLAADAAQAAAADLHRWLCSETGRLMAGSDLMREVPFVLRLERDGRRIEVSGTIDALARLADGRLWLLDYKYAHRKPSAPEYELQMRLYAAAIERAFGRLPQRMSLIYLKESEPVTDVDAGEAAVGAALDGIFSYFGNP